MGIGWKSLLSSALLLMCVGCATLERERPGWQCTAAAPAGAIKASATIWLEADGRKRSHHYAWEWASRRDGVELLEEQWLSDSPLKDEAGTLLVFVNLPKQLVRRVVRAEIDMGGEGGSIRTSNLAPHQPQYPFLVPISRLEEAVIKESAPAATGFDRNGALLFRMPLAMGPVTQGREALREAAARAEEMARSYAASCRRESRDEEGIVIA